MVKHIVFDQVVQLVRSGDSYVIAMQKVVGNKTTAFKDSLSDEQKVVLKYYMSSNSIVDSPPKLMALPHPELNTLARHRSRIKGKINEESIMLFKMMGESFTSKEFLSAGKSLGMPERTCYVYLRQYNDIGCLIRQKLGYYKKTPTASLVDKIIIKSICVGNSTSYEGYIEEI